MVDLTRDKNGKDHARLLDLVPGRSKNTYADWLTERGDDFCNGIKIAALDPFGGYKGPIDAELEDTVAVLDAFRVVKLGTTVVDEVRRRVQQDTLGHRGHEGDPLYSIQRRLRAGAENLTDKQLDRLATEPPWVCWRLVTLETRMEPCRRNRRLGSRRRGATAQRRRPRRFGWSARCEQSWGLSTGRSSGSPSPCASGSSKPTSTTATHPGSARPR
ncbi:hypothetical protein GCM10011331_22410 [Flavimobilis marinus]|nr:hypothetical protein GCM10011331_22410 [Flavimobilis marinus]